MGSAGAPRPANGRRLGRTRLRAKSAMQKSIYILDPNLRSLQGHHFEYDRSIAEAARREGIRCVVLAHREASLPCDLGLDVRPVFSSDMWKTFPGEKYHSPGNIAAVSSEFAAETFRLLDAEPIDDGSVVFLPSITKVDLPAAVEIARRFGARGATTTIMLRYQASLFDGPAA